MNKKGQVMSIVFGLIVFIILWAMFFAKWLNDWAEQFIVSSSLTGLEAFFVSYINVWVFAGVIIGVVSVLYFGGNQ